MVEIMTNGKTVRLNGRKMLDKYNVSKYRVAKRGGVSRPTVDRLADGDHNFHADTLYSFLVGLGLDDAQMLDLKFGDVFQIVPDAS